MPPKPSGVPEFNKPFSSTTASEFNKNKPPAAGDHTVSSIDTGTPGFDIDGKTYTYDVGDPDRPENDPNYPIATEHGGINVDQNDPPTKDLSKTTKKTLADYLGKKTSVNYIPVDSISNSVSITAINNETPVNPSSTVPTNNSKWFTKGKDNIGGTHPTTPGLKAWMNQSNLGDIIFSPPDVSSVKLKKGKTSNSDPGSVNGNELLNQVAQAPVAIGSTQETQLGTIKNYTTSVLKNNRFTAEANFANQNQTTGTKFDTFSPDDVVKGKFGLSTETKQPNSILYSPKYGPYTMNTMAQVGVSLSIRASRELNSAANNSDPTSAGQELKAILPSFNQLGASRIDVALLEASHVLTSLDKKEEIPESSFSSISDLSWGSLNNTLDTYDGMSAIGMVALSAALTASINLLFEGLGLILGLVKSVPNQKTSPEGRHIIGRSTYTKQSTSSGFGPLALLSLDLGSLLGIHPTFTPLKEAVRVGIHAFFGIDEDAGLLGSLAQSITKPNDSPGFNSVVARSIIRSIVVIIAKIKAAFSGNVVSAIKKILALIDVIKSSKLISAINVFASLGDAIKNENKWETIENEGEPDRKSRIDAYSDDAFYASATKNRLNNGKSLKLAWASNRSPALYLLPNTVASLQPAASSLGAFQNGLGLQEKETRSFYHILADSVAKTNGNRIPIDNDDPTVKTLKAMESIIEGTELFPFYFHDIRTNEVIAFHAFLASLTEDYTANYETTEAFGRVDPIKIYKNTHRKIGMSFYIAATSPEDFDDMWVKINKLVTLLYPQYTEGRQLTNPEANYKFTQPFSQMIGASPMIRLRLGNLFQTNYSRFALARLFGATIKGSKFGGEEADGTTIIDKSPEKLKNAIASLDKSYSWYLNGSAGVLEQLQKPGLISTSTGLRTAQRINILIYRHIIYIKMEITLYDEGADTVVITPQIPDAKFLSDLGITDTVEQQNIISLIKIVYDNGDLPSMRIIGGKYVAAVKNISPTESTIKKINERASSPQTEFVKDLSTFLDVEKNSIVKSFKSASGKGLAGFIDSMHFDWLDKMPWDVDNGKKAPMMCKVTIAFSPIHDISPGLDSQGYNRAPIYPVGFFRHGKDEIKKND